MEIRRYPIDEPRDWEGDGKSEVNLLAYFEKIAREIKKLGVDLAGSKVLEVGTGDNAFLDYVRRQGVDVTGVDARPRGENLGNLVASRIEALPFRDGVFDIVLSRQVFDESTYYQDQKAMVTEIRRVLKENGLYCGVIDKINVPIDGFALLDSSFGGDFRIYRKT